MGYFVQKINIILVEVAFDPFIMRSKKSECSNIKISLIKIYINELKELLASYKNLRLDIKTPTSYIQGNVIKFSPSLSQN